MSDPNRHTRRAPHMEKYIEIVPCYQDDFPDAHVVRLIVGNQRFQLDDFKETKAEAVWMGDMLCIALAGIVEDSKK